MSQGLTYFGKVDDNGKLTLRNESSFRSVLKDFRGYELCLSLRVAHTAASSPQFRYYRGVVLPYLIEAMIAAGHDGWSLAPEKIHAELYGRYSRYGFLKIEQIEQMPRELFWEYMESLKRLAAFLNVVVPDPAQKEFL